MAGKHLIEADDSFLEMARLIKLETLNAGLVRPSSASVLGCDDRARDRQHSPCSPHPSSSLCAPNCSNLIVVALASPGSACELVPRAGVAGFDAHDVRRGINGVVDRVRLFAHDLPGADAVASQEFRGSEWLLAAKLDRQQCDCAITGGNN
jgi:hypothetical protein